MNALTSAAAAKPKTSRLKAKLPELIKARHPTMLVFGPSGCGKTTWSCAWPDVFFIDCEGGATQPEYRERLRASGGHYLGPDEGANSFDVVMDQIKALTTETHDRKTLVIDSVSKLFATEVAREAERLTDAGKKNEFGADRKPAVNYMRQMVNWISRLNMNVVLIAGEIAEWSTDNRGDRVQSGTTFDCWPRLEYELDLAINVVKVGNSRYGKIRKSRVAAFPQASTFDFTFEAFATLYGQEIIGEAAERVIVATRDQLAEVNRLLAIVKLEDGTVDKWLAAANVSSWDEMTEDRIGKAIEYLKALISPQ